MYSSLSSQSALLTMTASLGPSPKFRKCVKTLADAGDVLGDLLLAHQLARLVAERGIADLGGAAAHQHDGLVPRLLQPPQQHDLHHAAHMQAVGRGVEADIGDDPLLPGEFIQRRPIGALMQESAVDDLAQKTGFELARHSHLTPTLEGPEVYHGLSPATILQLYKQVHPSPLGGEGAGGEG